MRARSAAQARTGRRVPPAGPRAAWATRPLLAVVVGVALAGCAGPRDEPAPDAALGAEADDGVSASAEPTPGASSDMTSDLSLTSPDADAGGRMPSWATGDYRGYCDGENRSPALAWDGAPAGTAGYALVLVDVASSGYVHWVVSGIPGTATGLEQADEGQVGTGVVGTSLAGGGAYVGPCAVEREYRYVLYALDEGWTGTPGTTMSTLLAEIEGHVLATAELVVSPAPDGA